MQGFEIVNNPEYHLKPENLELNCTDCCMFPVGSHDGVIGGKQYFSTTRDRGEFFPLPDVVRVSSDQVRNRS